jgi:hypothetical protein
MFIRSAMPLEARFASKAAPLRAPQQKVVDLVRLEDRSDSSTETCVMRLELRRRAFVTK